jgi:hypothetical protein
MTPMGAKKNMKTMISAIQKALEEPAARKELDVCEAASTIAQIGKPQKRTKKRSTTVRSGPKTIASTRCQLSGHNRMLFPGDKGDPRSTGMLARNNPVPHVYSMGPREGSSVRFTPPSDF